MDQVASLLYECGNYTEAHHYDQRLQPLLDGDLNTPITLRATLRSLRCLLEIGRAIETHEQAKTALHQSDLSARARAELLIVSASALVMMERFYEALRTCDEAEGLTFEDDSVGQSFLARGWAFIGLGRPGEAIQAFQNALSRFRKAGWDYGCVRVLHSMSVVQKNVGDWESSARSLHSCIRHLRKLCFPYLHSYVLLQLGLLNLRLGVPRRALRHLNEAIRLANLMDNTLLTTNARIARVRAFRLLGSTNESRKEIGEARETSGRIGYSRAVALCHEESGELALLDGDIDGAEHHFQDGLEIARRIAPQGDLFAELARRLADVRIEKGDLPAAKELVRQALHVSRSCLDRREEGTCYRTLARIARHQGDTSKSRENYNRAVAVFRLIQDRVELARTLEERASLISPPEKDRGEACVLYTRAGMTEDAARVARAIEKDALPDPAIRDSRRSPDPFVES